MPIYKLLIEKRIIDVEVGPPRFGITTDNLGWRKLCFFEVRETEFKNLVWMRIMSLSLKFPFIKIAGGFVSEGGE